MYGLQLGELAFRSLEYKGSTLFKSVYELLLQLILVNWTSDVSISDDGITTLADLRDSTFFKRSFVDFRWTDCLESSLEPLFDLRWKKKERLK